MNSEAIEFECRFPGESFEEIILVVQRPPSFSEKEGSITSKKCCWESLSFSVSSNSACLEAESSFWALLLLAGV